MAHEQLDNLVRSGHLKPEQPVLADIETLVQSGLARLADAGNQTLALESRFDLAYSAAHALARAALLFHGYRAENRYVVFQCLPHTLQLEPAQWRVLDRAHQKRNLSEYRGAEVDEQLVAAILRVAQEVAARVRKLLEGTT
jgi:hypothetical protein